MSDGLSEVHTDLAPAAGATRHGAATAEVSGDGARTTVPPVRDAHPDTSSSAVAARTRPVLPPAVLPPSPAARPRIVDESAILGLSRVSRGRVGSRLFTGFFVFVFALIAVQMIVALLTY